MSKRPLSQEEKRLWHHFTHHVTPVDEVYDVQHSEPEKAKMVHSKRLNLMDLSVQESSYPRTAQFQSDYNLRSLDKSTLKRLRRGQMKPDAVLDLHGKSRLQAMIVFEDFIRHSCIEGKRTVRVITGYGSMTGVKGVLWSELPRWVSLPENQRFILYCEQARPEEGGKGAWVLYLKRKERL